MASRCGEPPPPPASSVRTTKAVFRLLVAGLLVCACSSRWQCAGSTPLSQRSQPQLPVVTHPTPCSLDGWCRAGPYLPEVRTAGSSAERWQLVDRRQVFRKRASEGWQPIPFPARFGTEIASGGDGAAWVLSPKCRWLSGREVCPETVVNAFDGRDWSAQVLPNHVWSIWASSRTDAWAVGGRDETPDAPVQLHRWNGLSWQPVSPRPTMQNTTGPLKKVVGTSSSNVWAAGGESIVHWNGRELVAMTPDTVDISELPGPGWKEPRHSHIPCHYDEILLSDAGVSFLADEPLCPPQAPDKDGRLARILPGTRLDLDAVMTKRDDPRGAQSGRGTAAFGRPGRNLYSIVIDGHERLWASAEGWFNGRHSNDGTIVGFDGTAWREWSWTGALGGDYCGRTVEKQHEVAFDGTAAYSLSSYSGLAILEAGVWRSLHTDEWSLGHGLCAMWSAPGLPLFVGTRDSAQTWNGRPIFELISEIAAGLETPPGAFWASAQDDLWFATIPCMDLKRSRDQRCPARLYHFDGRSSSEYPAAHLGCAYRAIHGVSRQDVWLVGDEGCSAHFDGRGWSRVSTGTRARLRDVAACSSSEAWAIGDRGTILRWDGSSWHPVDSGTGQTLHGIAGCGSSALWAVGDAGTVLRRASAAQGPP